VNFLHGQKNSKESNYQEGKGYFEWYYSDAGEEGETSYHSSSFAVSRVQRSHHWYVRFQPRAPDFGPPNCPGSAVAVSGNSAGNDGVENPASRFYSDDDFDYVTSPPSRPSPLPPLAIKSWKTRCEIGSRTARSGCSRADDSH
jgi:hypothetical protein